MMRTSTGDVPSRADGDFSRRSDRLRSISGPAVSYGDSDRSDARRSGAGEGNNAVRRGESGDARILLLRAA